MSCPRVADCALCERYRETGPGSVCLPMRPLTSIGGGRRDALLVVAQSPGPIEDRKASILRGRTGRCLTAVYLTPFYDLPLDIWATNAVKCLVPPGESPLKSEITKCRVHLQRDIDYLQEHYSNLTILCLGTVACQSVLRVPLKKALGQQGSKVVVLGGISPDVFEDGLSDAAVLSRASMGGRKQLGGEIPVFATYHPAAIDRPGGSGNPAKMRSVVDHLRLLHEHLCGQNTTAKWTISDFTRDQGPPKLPPGAVVSCDIETYGLIDGLPDQTTFHPRKSVALDGVRRGHLIQTVALSWREGGEPGTWEGISSTIIPWGPKAPALIRRWLVAARQAGGFFLFQNCHFDISYLRYSSPDLSEILKPGFPIWDLILTSFFENPERDERSLKSLSTILGLGAYDPGCTYPNKWHPKLWQYNVEDTEKTLLCHERLLARVPKTRRWTLSPFATSYWRDVLWTCIELEETGIAVDVNRLRRFGDNLAVGIGTLESRCAESDLIISGKGSQGSRRTFIADLCEKSGISPYLTEKTESIQVTEEQIQRILKDGAMLGDVPRRLLRFLIVHGKLRKLLGTYVRPRLEGGKKSSQHQSKHIEGFLYPTWYACPSADKDTSMEGGGQRQARIAARYPAIQTDPPPLSRMVVSRFKGGTLLAPDYSQIELRIAGLLSGEPAILDEYRKGPDMADLHTATALTFPGFGAISQEEYDRRPKFWRQIAKTLNFAVLYGCGAGKLQTILQTQGAYLDWKTCAGILSAYAKSHPVLMEWHEALLEEAARGTLEVPIIGLVRLFEGSPETIAETYRNEVLNCEVQALAGAVALSGQRVLMDAIHHWKMRSVIYSNVYDGIPIDCFPGEEKAIRCLGGCLLNPPVYRELCGFLGRSVPLEVDWK